MAGKVLQMKAKQPSGLPWYTERGGWHPRVEDELDWYLFAHCAHVPSDVSQGQLHHARDCALCLKDRYLEQVKLLRDMLAPLV